MKNEKKVVANEFKVYEDECYQTGINFKYKHADLSKKINQ